MSAYEYKVVPAPAKGQKGKGVKTGEARFALAIETLMNEMAAEGWEYQRAETLPSQERSGIAGSVTEWRNVLVFRRQQAVPEFSSIQRDEDYHHPVSPMAPRRVPGPHEPARDQQGGDVAGLSEHRSNLAHLAERRSTVDTE